MRSPRSSSGRPTTAASATPGCSSSAFSISPAPILKPPDLIRSVALRPTSASAPDAVNRPMSPVANQPSAVCAAAVASGRFR